MYCMPPRVVDQISPRTSTKEPLVKAAIISLIIIVPLKPSVKSRALYGGTVAVLVRNAPRMALTVPLGPAKTAGLPPSWCELPQLTA